MNDKIQATLKLLDKAIDLVDEVRGEDDGTAEEAYSLITEAYDLLNGEYDD